MMLLISISVLVIIKKKLTWKKIHPNMKMNLKSIKIFQLKMDKNFHWIWDLETRKKIIIQIKM
jgi:hypothetical protein